MPPPASAPWILCVCLVFAGCGGHRVADQLTDEMVLRYGELPGAAGSTRLELREEIARLEQQGTTPGGLAAVYSATDQGDAGFLAGLFHANDLEKIHRETAEQIPRPSLRVGPIELEQLVRYRQRYDPQRLQARRRLESAEEESAAARGFVIDLQRGWFADLRFISAAAICARLELLAALEQSAEGSLPEAVASLESLLRLCERLSHTPSVQARLTAVELRAEALQLLGLIVQHPAADEELAAELAGLLEAALARWPRDADLWIADRALGLHTYEVIRGGHLLKLLTPEEIRQFGEEGILRDLERAAARGIDRDELFYLQALERIIAGCRVAESGAGEVPYYLRADALESIWRELEALRGSADYPLIAARLLLTDIRPAARLPAIDRGRCEGWLLALQTALGAERPAYRRHPATGVEYEVRIEPHRVVVGDLSGGDLTAAPHAVVPRFEARLSRLP